MAKLIQNSSQTQAQTAEVLFGKWFGRGRHPSSSGSLLSILSSLGLGLVYFDGQMVE